MILYIIVLVVCCGVVMVSEDVLISGGFAFIALSCLLSVIRSVVCDFIYFEDYSWLFSLVAFVIGFVGAIALFVRGYLEYTGTAEELLKSVKLFKSVEKDLEES